MCKSALKNEDIFFGIISADGAKSSVINGGPSPTLSEMEALWQRRPDLFGHSCPACAGMAFEYSHTIHASAESPTRASASIAHFHCPACGHRFQLGANYLRQKMVVEEIEKIGQYAFLDCSGLT